MARIRTIKPAFFRSASVAELPSDACRLTWVGMWTYCDDQGRGVDDARLVKGEIWPLHDRITTKVVESHLAALAAGDEPMICRYQVAGRKYLHVVKWREHQKINRPQSSLIGACPIHERSPENEESFTERAVNEHGALTALSRQEGKGREEEGKGEGREGKSSNDKQQQQTAVAPPDERPAAAAATSRQDLLLAAFERIYARRKPPERNPQRHREVVIAAFPADFAERIAAIDWGRQWTPDELADWLEPVRKLAVVPHPADFKRPECELCGGSSFVIGDDGQAVRCDHRARALEA